jgi:hypothetical protein
MAGGDWGPAAGFCLESMRCAGKKPVAGFSEAMSSCMARQRARIFLQIADSDLLMVLPTGAGLPPTL